MSKNIKNLIDNIEEQGKTRAELEQTIEKLKEEIKKLNSKIQEEKILRQVSKSDMGDKATVPDEVQILKDMILSQRKDLIQKEEEIETLKKKLDGTQESNEMNAQLMSSSSEELITQQKAEIETYKINENDAKSLVEQLLEENEQYRLEIRTFKTQLDNLKIKPSTRKNSQDVPLEEVKLEKRKLKKKNSTAIEIDLKQELKEENLENLENENRSVEIKSTEDSGIGLTKKIENSLEESKATKEELNEVSEGLYGKQTENFEQSSTEVTALKEESRDINDKSSFNQASQYSEIQTKKQIVSVDASYGRRKCPQCGNNNKTYIYESIDKTNILMASPRMYGKKFKCGKCAFEWRLKESQ